MAGPTVEAVDTSVFSANVRASGVEAPRPVRAGLAIAGLAVIPLAGILADLIWTLSGLVFAGIFVAAGTLRAALAYHELVGLRRTGDRELRLGTHPYLLSAVAAW